MTLVVAVLANRFIVIAMFIFIFIFEFMFEFMFEFIEFMLSK